MVTTVAEHANPSGTGCARNETLYSRLIRPRIVGEEKAKVNPGSEMVVSHVEDFGLFGLCRKWWHYRRAQLPSCNMKTHKETAILGTLFVASLYVMGIVSYVVFRSGLVAVCFGLAAILATGLMASVAKAQRPN